MKSDCLYLAPLLLLAALLAVAAGAARGQAAATDPAAPASQPAADPGVDTEGEEFWDEPREPAVLTTAAEVRALTAEQAAAGRPVRIRGTLFYVAGFPPVLFLQDSTGGVCVAGLRDREARTPLRHASFMQVEGVTAWGGAAAYVTGAGNGPLKLELVAPTGRLSAPRLATVPQLTTPALHGELMEVEGVVRSVRTERLGAAAPDATVVTIAQGGGRVEAVLLGKAGESITPEEYVGAAVRARGVFNAATPRQMDVVGRRLLLRLARDLAVRAPAATAGQLPLTPIGSLTPGAPSAQPRVKVQGVVTLVLPGRGMFLQDSTGGVWVTAGQVGTDQEPTARAPAVRAGDSVEAVGFPGRRGWSTVLTDSAWTRTGTAAMPDAPLVAADQALAPGMDARLVRVDALVLSVSRISQYTTFALQSGGRVFLARLADTAAGPPADVKDGSWVRVSGVCVQTPVDNSWQTAAGTATDAPPAAPAAAAGAAPDANSETTPGLSQRPPSFYLLVASDKAVQTISPPGWWTPQRVLVVCGVLAAVALASIAWVVALRRRVTRQTGMIREHLASRALYEERVRIARELHDSLEQDLLGITMQLNATEKLLTQPERARQSLQLAAAMVRRSQAETHRAVWDLRDQRGRAGLLPAIQEAVEGLAAPRGGNGNGNGDGEGPRVEVRGVGEPRGLPPHIENHLQRVALEAVTNAMKHAHASLIRVEVAFLPGRVEVTVTDDGRGFDAERLPPPSSGHFGLFGMRERAEKLGGQLTIRSHAGGGGSEIRLVVPTGANGSSTGVDEPTTATSRAAGTLVS